MIRTAARVFVLFVVCTLWGAAAGGYAQQSLQRPGVGGIDDLPAVIHFDELRALRAFFERVDVSRVADGVPAPRSSSSGFDDALNGLPPDFEAPFFLVQGTIGHVPYAGSVRGAFGTLEAGAGNALDQALLLQALFAARGVNTRLVRGSLDWDAAVALVGGAPMTAAPQAGDPWPRWVEQAADHWWLQAQSDDGWVDFDPGFIDTEPGESRAGSGTPQEVVPSELQTTVRVELVRGDLTLAEADYPASRLVGDAVSLRFVSESQAAIDLWRQVEDLLDAEAERFGPLLRDLGWTPSVTPIEEDAAPPATDSPTLITPGTLTTPSREVEPEPQIRRPSAFERIFLDANAGPWRAQLSTPVQILEAGPFEGADLDALSLRLTVSAPQAPPHVLETPWGGPPEGRLTVVFGAGAVSQTVLRQHARDMYRALNGLAVVEQAARVNMRPPIAYGAAVDVLRDEASEQWERFATGAPEALAWALLHGVDGVSGQSATARVVRPGLRLAAVRWRTSSPLRASGLEVWMSDPVLVGQVVGATNPAALRSAAGLLQSAVFSQVLNRLTERAPETAFDVTLRAIGTGRDLQVFQDAAEIPGDWPLLAQAEAAAGLREGYRVLAPLSFADGAAGWWTVGTFDGETRGWVPGPATALQGSVEVGAPGDLENFDALLASLPGLHRALRWLADVPGAGPLSLSTVPDAACASATVAADIMTDGMPADWPRPDVVGLCGPR